MEHLCAVDTPVGRLMIGERDGAVTRIDVTEADLPAPHTPVQQACARQLADYFAGARRVFDVPVSPEGTAFQREVWAALAEIPWGERRTYGEIAALIGRPSACRAVGGAIHRNPVLILIPCHRVVGRSGALTGFRAGLHVKAALLQLERGGLQDCLSAGR